MTTASGYTEIGRLFDRLSGTIESLSRYDLLLLVVPLAFAVALPGSYALGASSRVALVAASFVGALAVADGLFVNPPRGGGR